jgi:dihydroxy-acid dehydratase
MKYSLVSREVIADAIETACNGESMDGVLAVGGCDKNMPGAMLAMARMNIPAIFVYGGTIKPGKLGGCDLTVVSAFEAVGQFAAGKIDDDQLMAVEKNACPGAGSCGGMFTANTMSSAIEAMGLSLPGSSTMAAEDAEKADSAARSAEVLVEAIAKNIRPLDLLTREAFAQYWRHMKPDGVLAVHVSNLYIDLAPIVAAAALDDHKTARLVSDKGDDAQSLDHSDWVLIAADPAFFQQKLLADADLQYIPVSLAPWTDDYSNLWRSLR